MKTEKEEEVQKDLFKYEKGLQQLQVRQLTQDGCVYLKKLLRSEVLIFLSVSFHASIKEQLVQQIFQFIAQHQNQNLKQLSIEYQFQEAVPFNFLAQQNVKFQNLKKIVITFQHSEPAVEQILALLNITDAESLHILLQSPAKQQTFKALILQLISSPYYGQSVTAARSIEFDIQTASFKYGQNCIRANIQSYSRENDELIIAITNYQGPQTELAVLELCVPEIQNIDTLLYQISKLLDSNVKIKQLFLIQPIAFKQQSLVESEDQRKIEGAELFFESLLRHRSLQILQICLNFQNIDQKIRLIEVCNMLYDRQETISKIQMRNLNLSTLNQDKKYLNVEVYLQNQDNEEALVLMQKAQEMNYVWTNVLIRDNCLYLYEKLREGLRDRLPFLKNYCLSICFLTLSNGVLHIDTVKYIELVNRGGENQYDEALNGFIASIAPFVRQIVFAADEYELDRQNYCNSEKLVHRFTTYSKFSQLSLQLLHLLMTKLARLFEENRGAQNLAIISLDFLYLVNLENASTIQSALSIFPVKMIDLNLSLAQSEYATHNLLLKLIPIAPFLRKLGVLIIRDIYQNVNQQQQITQILSELSELVNAAQKLQELRIEYFVQNSFYHERQNYQLDENQQNLITNLFQSNIKLRKIDTQKILFTGVHKNLLAIRQRKLVQEEKLKTLVRYIAKTKKVRLLRVRLDIVTEMIQDFL